MRFARTVLTIAAALALAGCGGAQVSGSPATSSASSASQTHSDTAPTTVVTPEVTPTEDPTPTDEGTLAFGKSFRWEDGVEMTISAPKNHKLGKYSFAKGPAVEMTVTVRNGGTAAIDLTTFTATAMVGDTEAKQVFDTAGGLELAPQTKLRPGKSVHFKIGFEGKPGASWTVDANPGFLGYTDATWATR